MSHIYVNLHHYCFKIHVELEHFSPRDYLFVVKPQDNSSGKNICMKITSLLFTHYTKGNMLNSNTSMTHEFDVLETTAQGITESLVFRIVITYSLNHLRRKFDQAFFDGQKGLDRE